jgi:hypothetical protein
MEGLLVARGACHLKGKIVLCLPWRYETYLKNGMPSTSANDSQEQIKHLKKTAPFSIFLT